EGRGAALARTTAPASRDTARAHSPRARCVMPIPGNGHSGRRCAAVALAASREPSRTAVRTLVMAQEAYPRLSPLAPTCAGTHRETALGPSARPHRQKAGRRPVPTRLHATPIAAHAPRRHLSARGPT